MAKQAQTSVQNRLRDYREQAGLSRADLVYLLRTRGVRLTESAIYDIETGRSETMIHRNAQMLARILGEQLDLSLTSDDLFPFPEKEPPTKMNRPTAGQRRHAGHPAADPLGSAAA